MTLNAQTVFCILMAAAAMSWTAGFVMVFSARRPKVSSRTFMGVIKAGWLSICAVFMAGFLLEFLAILSLGLM